MAQDTERRRLWHILLVEDDPGDHFLVQKALQDSASQVRLHHVEDGEEALDYLHQRGRFIAAVRPDLILLDLNLPKKDGAEVLAEIKADVDLKSIAVVILTTSKTHREMVRIYDLFANCFITKPADTRQFKHVIQSLYAFWFGVASLP